MTQGARPPSGFILMIVKIALVALVVETVIMLAFYWLGIGLSDWKFALLDAGLLAIFVAIIAYYAFVRPKDRQIRSMMTSLDQARLKAEELARLDALTGVLSRRAVLEALDEEVERAKRHGDGLACLMLDLDGFKAINDSYGHQFGDQALRRIARAIAELCRAYDHLGRYGGEEFLLILPETRLDGAVAFAERVRLAVAATALDENGECITISIGVTERLGDDVSSDTLIAEADRALLDAKNAGRNRVVVHSVSRCPH